MTDVPETVSELGERGVIRRIIERIGHAPEGETWAGDDAAVVASPGETLIYTTDVMVEDVDFDLSYGSATDVGWKAIAINASDVAAMAGRPRYGVVTLGVDPETPVAVVDALLEGMIEASARYDASLVGGDVTRATQLWVGVAMIGAVAQGGAVRRSGARAGDAICVTGSLGGAAGGLVVLRRGLADEAPGGSGDAGRRLATRQLRPHARVDEALRLADVGVSAMIDVSDGLAVDLGHVLDASGTGCVVDPDAIPVDADLGVLQVLLPGEPFDPLPLAIAGGEDFELLFTIEEERVDDTRLALEPLTSVARIGTVTDGARRIGDRDLEEWRELGWDHLRSP